MCVCVCVCQLISSHRLVEHREQSCEQKSKSSLWTPVDEKDGSKTIAFIREGADSVRFTADFHRQICGYSSGALSIAESSMTEFGRRMPETDALNISLCRKLARARPG